jgi:N-acetylneuraminic acid mutarotase
MFPGFSFSSRTWMRMGVPLLLLAFGVAQESWALDAKAASHSKPLDAHTNISYRGLPLSFESNQGQADRTTRFLAHGAGYSIVFKDREALLLLSGKRSMREQPHQPGMFPSASGQAADTKNDTIKMRLSGPTGGLQPIGEARQPGTVNYFFGNHPGDWKTGIPTYEKVRYTGVYPGVNLIYYGSRQQLEFDFEVAPGADARQIRLRFDGAHKLTLDPEGNLAIVAANGAISFHRPVVYQVAADNSRQPVAGSFQVLSRKTVGFRVGSYDRSKPLVIDPILNYSTYLGGSSEATAIAVDSAGATYVTGGALQGMPASGIQSLPATKTSSSFGSAFVAKFNSTGTALVYCTYMSGSGNDLASAIAVDSSGNAYVAGATSSPNFPTTTGAFQSRNNAGAPLSTGFVSKINSTGTALDYSTYLGGSAGSGISGIGVDASGSVYVTGTTQATNFPTTQGAFQSSNKASSTETGFVTKLNSTGTGLTYSTYLGGSTEDELNGIAVDSTGNAYVAGSSLSTDFPTTAGAFQTANKTDPTSWSASLTKVNPAGTGLVYSTYFGGNGENSAQAIALDASGDAFVTGNTTATDFPISPGAFQPVFRSVGFNVELAYATELNVAGSDLVYSTYLGGSDPKWGICVDPNGGLSWSTGLGIAVDAHGNTYVAGSTNQIDFPVTSSSLEPASRSVNGTCTPGAFLSQINSGGTRLLYSTYLSGSGNSGPPAYQAGDYVNGIALDSAGDAYLAGNSVSIDFPTTLGAYQVSPGGTFVTEFNASELTSLPVPTIELSSAVNQQNPTPPVTFTVQFQSASGKTPTGTVAFSFSTGQPSAPMSPWTTIALDPSGTATYTPSGWTSVPATVAVYYLGDEYNAPASLQTTVVSTNPPLPVVIAITANPNPASYGATVTFNVSVSDPSGKGIPAGSVAVQYIPNANTNVSYATGTLDSSGKASLTASAFPSIPSFMLPPGAYPLTVTFTPSNLFYASGTGNYTENVPAQGVTPTPVISPAAGAYASAQSVTITDSAANAQILYTDKGATPGLFSFPYSSPLQVTSCETISAIAVAPGYLPSAATFATYVINASPGTTTPQANEWAWMNGGCNGADAFSPGVYGQQGVPAAGNTPGGRESAVSWTDKNGNFWLFGNAGLDSTGWPGILNDLWQFAPSTNQWTWMDGGTTFPASCQIPNTSVTCSMPGVYGTYQTPAAGNTPGSRENEVTWTDKNGNLWLFGGIGFLTAGGVNYNGAPLNDLWEFNPSLGEWAWMGGSSSYQGNPDVYGTLGQPATGNTPGSRAGESTWTDGSGNLWLFGGSGVDSTGTSGDLNDLWMFNPSSNEWTWMGGVSTIPQSDPIICYPCSSPGVYGAQGTFAPGNIPSGRSGAAIWTGKNGSVWLFGGVSNIDYSNDNGDNYGSEGSFINDLWEFNPSTNQWAWMGGNGTMSLSASSLPGVYGTLGTPAATNIPGGRSGEATWIDSSGNLWLYGGSGFDSAGNFGELNDVWEFNPSTNQWTWMGGSSTFLSCMTGISCRQPGVYGTLGTPSIANIPGSRSGESTWTDKNGNLWLFGGWGYDSTGTEGYLNDLWVFNPAADEWAWMGGSSTVPNTGGNSGSQSSAYNAIGTFASSNVPGGRVPAASWTDNGGNFWLLGGTGNLNDLWQYVPSAPAPVPSFALSASPASVSIVLGASSSSTVAISAAGGFDSSVALTASGEPVGITVSFNPSSVTGAGISTMVLNASSSAVVTSNSYVTVTGTSGSSSQTSVVQLTLLPQAATPQVGVSPSASSITTAQALPVTITVSGGNGNPIPTGTVTLTSGTYASAATALNSGSASINIPAGSLAAGADTLTASYTPDSHSSATYASATGHAPVTVTVAVNPSFTVSGTAVTVAPGATTNNTSTITVTPAGGFTGSVALTAVVTASPSGALDLPTFSFGGTTPLTFAGPNPRTATLTVTTTATTRGALDYRKRPRAAWYMISGATLACMLIFGIPTHRRRWQTMLGLLALMVTLSGGVLACGSGGSSSVGAGGGGTPGTTAGTYTITLTGTSGGVSETGTVTLVVQ